MARLASRLARGDDQFNDSGDTNFIRAKVNATLVFNANFGHDHNTGWRACRERRQSSPRNSSQIRIENSPGSSLGGDELLSAGDWLIIRRQPSAASANRRRMLLSRL